MKKNNLRVNLSIATSAGIKKVNEDASWVGVNATNQVLAIICDGIGSQEGSKHASYFIVDFFVKSFKNKKHIYFIQHWFKIVLDKAYFELNRNHKDVDIGTTLVLCILSDDKAFIFNIGDSRAYHYDNSFNEWYCVTIDHNLYNFLEQNHAPQSIFDKNRNSLLSLTQYISSKSNKHMKYSFYLRKINKDDLFLLASDGLYNYFQINEINYILSFERANGFENICKSLVNKAFKNGSNDNITAILIETYFKN